jgi:hypothetical protein
MKPTELRLGNLVLLNGFVKDGELCFHSPASDPKWQEVFLTPWLLSQILSLRNLKEDTDLDYFLNPIPLTEDFLMSFGFTTITINKDGSTNFWNKECDCSIDVEITGINLERLFKYRVCEQKRTKSIASVHELQNLYFALTGSELTLKETVNK